MADDEKTVIVNGIPCRTIMEMILYKADRTIAIVGIVAIGIWAMAKATPLENISLAAISGLVGYVGGRTGTKST